MHILTALFVIFNILLGNIHFPRVHISAHFKYSMLLCVQITFLSYCSVATFLPSSMTPLANGASTIVGNAIVHMQSSYIAPTANHQPLPKGRHLNAVARTPEQRSPPKAGSYASSSYGGISRSSLSEEHD